MNILILGGTRFLGRHLVEAALARGHTLTLFNRGRSNPGLFPAVETLHGDRDGDLSALAGRRWDAVIDTCGYLPRVVARSAELLAHAVGQYTFISSISVYSEPMQPGADERAPVGTLDDPTVEEVTGETYGPLKALCEQAAERALPGRTLTIRPGLIVGPHDPTDRFTYWPARVARGGEVLAPGKPGQPVQVIDARDLAEWNIRMVEQGASGLYNATGPAERLPMGELLQTCRAVSGSDARFVWVDEQFLLDAGVGPWVELPLWLPEQQGGEALSSVNCARAISAGLSFRPLAETVRDTLEWDAARPQPIERRAGLDAEKEARVLEQWKARQG
jgi:2'-hydroxyisoflavone reductase